MNGFFQKLFPFLALLSFLLFIGMVWKDYDRPYLQYQQKFKTMLDQKSIDVRAGRPDMNFKLDIGSVGSANSTGLTVARPATWVLKTQDSRMRPSLSQLIRR